MALAMVVFTGWPGASWADEPSRGDGAEVDGAEVDGAEVDGAEVDGAEVDGAKVDDADEATRRGREAYLAGLAAADAEQWGEALIAFESAARHRNAALVQFNIAYCLRALGRYVAARAALRRAVAFSEPLPEVQARDARVYLEELEALVAELDVTLRPSTAELSVDGRALVRAAGDDRWLATGPAGEGTKVGKTRFTLLVDPGAHVFKASRPGHAPAVARVSVASGAREKVDLVLDRLPAEVRIGSKPAGAVVRVEGVDVGLTPVAIQRPAGRYAVELVQEDFEPYHAELELGAGEQAALSAEMVEASTPVYQTWWFWTSAAAVVATGAVVTWAVTRPDPEPAPYQAGSSGWLVQPSSGWSF